MQELGGYRLEAEIGRGGQAVVYRGAGRDGRAVAVKAWLALGADPARTRATIRRESTLVERIAHPGVVRLIEAAPDASPPYLVFDYVDGSTLQDRVGSHGPLRGEPLHQLVVRSLEALLEVHSVPVAHLDLKPANVVLRTTGAGLQPVLIDFGIARSADTTHTRWTGQSSLFASPEQLLMRQAGTPSDVFSWASVSYFAATGIAPFGDEPSVARTRILDTDWLPARAPFDAALDGAPGLWDVLVGCWHRDPVLRWPLLIAANGSRPSRPMSDTRALLGAVENCLGAPAAPRLRRGRIDPRRAGPTPWHELGAHLRHRRRHGMHPMTLRRMAAQRELLGRVSTVSLWAYEMGWREPGYDVVSIIDAITGADGYLRHLYACARGSDALELTHRPRGSRYPVPGDVSEQHPDTPAMLQVVPWQQTVFPVVLRNAGRVPWTGRYLRAVGPVTGTETVPVRADRIAIPDTAPGDLVRIEIPVRAPGWPAVYRQRFKMVDDEGAFCFPTGNTLGIEVMLQVVRDER